MKERTETADAPEASGGQALSQKGAPVCVLGVTGSVAAYKAPDIAARLVRQGVRVVPVLTEGGAHFITPQALSATARAATRTSLWEDVEESLHLALAGADVVVVAPASADFLARAALGLAGDLLGTLLLARDPALPVLMAPAMETHMWRHPATQAHVRTLRERGVRFLGPVEGALASGREGIGRMVEPDAVVDAVRTLLAPKDLAGRRVLVTAGPTQEPIDPVRFVGNRSSGKMGYAIARAAARRGADVVLVSGPVAQPAPPEVRLVRVDTAQAMARAVEAALPDRDMVIAAAAVSDYRPARTWNAKLHRSSDTLTLELVRTPDVLGLCVAASGRQRRVIVGFAAETEDPEASARDKLTRKGLDLCVGNDVSRPESTFGSDTNRVVIVDREGGVERLGVLSKEAVADHILTRALALATARGEAAGIREGAEIEGPAR